MAATHCNIALWIMDSDGVGNYREALLQQLREPCSRFARNLYALLMAGGVILRKLFRIAEIDAARQSRAHLRAEFHLEPFHQSAAAQICVHGRASIVFFAPPVLQPDDHYAAGNNAAYGTASADSAAEAGSALEDKVVI
jgi:hypothetical protein